MFMIFVLFEVFYRIFNDNVMELYSLQPSEACFYTAKERSWAFKCFFAMKIAFGKDGVYLVTRNAWKTPLIPAACEHQWPLPDTTLT